MMKKKDYIKKKPELYIDGQKIAFHYNRDERLAKAQHKIETDSSFFGKNNRSLHIIIVNIIIIVIVGLIFSKFSNKAISNEINGFKFFFFKKNYFDSPILDFRMQVKNITKDKNILEENFRDMDLIIYDANEKNIYTKEFYIKKNILKPNEYYTEYIIIEKPKTQGKYKAQVNYGPDKNLNLSLNFIIKKN